MTSSQSQLLAASRWFLHSGIQTAPGGVARYYYSDRAENARVSNEITGYAVSTLLFLARRNAEPEARHGALRAAAFLCRHAWQPPLMPFEWSPNGDLPEHHSYFFDCGIIARGLLAAYRDSGDSAYLEVATGCGHSMRRDFVTDVDIHPILELPSLTPVARDWRWSRQSGCYQLKSALAWLDLAEITGESAFADAYETALAFALASHAAFPEHAPERLLVMDRLHAYCYFFEGLMPRAARPECRAALATGIAHAAALLREIRPAFVRSDVCAQLLRARLYAEVCAGLPLDEAAAEEEAAWAASFQSPAGDARTQGGFCFGARDGRWMPFVNPVSTAFCAQALALWDDRRNGPQPLHWRDLI